MKSTTISGESVPVNWQSINFSFWINSEIFSTKVFNFFYSFFLFFWYAENLFYDIIFSLHKNSWKGMSRQWLGFNQDLNPINLHMHVFLPEPILFQLLLRVFLHYLYSYHLVRFEINYLALKYLALNSIDSHSQLIFPSKFENH